jgi:hypothetical protein
MFWTRSIERKLKQLLARSAEFGLGETDYKNAEEALDANEWELCFDTVASQLFEYGITVDADFVRSMYEAADEMNIAREKYSFLEDLIPHCSFNENQ